MSEGIGKKEFVGLMARLRSCYQNSITDKEMWVMSMRTYYDALSRLDPDRVRAAFAAAPYRHPQWMPSLGQLLELVHGSIADRADAAWYETRRLAQQASGDHSDPIARDVIAAMGGGKRLGQMTDLDTTGRREFIAAYKRALAGTKEEAHARIQAPTGPSV